MLAVLREVGADVIALQEADRRLGARAAAIPPLLLADHSPWKAVPFGMRALSMGWHGNAMLVRKDTDVIACAAIHLPALEPRGAVIADLRIAGTAVRIVGMHLDLSGLWRRRQAHAILAHVAALPTRLPTILMGDLNEWGTRGCLLDFGRHHAFAMTTPSFHARRPVARLDRIMVGSGIAITASGTHTSPAATRASDHLPIWASLTL